MRATHVSIDSVMYESLFIFLMLYREESTKIETPPPRWGGFLRVCMASKFSIWHNCMLLESFHVSVSTIVCSGTVSDSRNASKTACFALKL